MNRNGYSGIGRVTVATTSSSVTPADHLPWFPSTAAGDGSCPSIGRRSPPLHPTGTTTTAHSRRLSSRTALSLSPADSLHSVHAAAPPHLEMQSVLNSSQSSIGSLFRPPLTVADPAPRIYHSTQYGGSLYTTANTTIASFSSLYSIHGQPASHMTSGAVSPYNTFYAQYPQGYSHGCLLSPAGHYPHIDSYSAVLASMGSHAQHVSQSQLPRTFMPTHLSQYSTLSSHRTATPTTSPTSSGSIRHSPSQQALMHRHSPKAEQLRDSLSEAAVVAAVEGYGQSPHGLSTKDEKSHSTSQHMQSRQLSPLTAHNKSSGSVVKEPSIKSDLNKDMGYKLPSGKEGSLKHRILTRPSNSQINECPVSGSEQIMSAGTKGYAKSEAISPAKRSKSISEMASSDSDAGCGQSQSQGTGPAQGVPNVPMIPHLHYPPHFMKGSIIQLANGDLKRVEDLQTDDFIHSAEISADLKIDSSTVVRTDKNIERGTTILSFLVGENKVQVTVEATLEHPFFVFGQGWSSCCPQRTIKRYGLDCHKLSVGDVCISLTHKEVRRDTNQLHYQQIPKGTDIDGEHHPTTNTTPNSPMLTDSNSLKPSAYLSRHRSPPADMALYQRSTKTHSTETQTSLDHADNNNNNNSNNNNSSSSVNTDSRNRSVGQPVRKRRWSAPGKMSFDSRADFGKSSPLVEKNEPEIQRKNND